MTTNEAKEKVRIVKLAEKEVLINKKAIPPSSRPKEQKK